MISKTADLNERDFIVRRPMLYNFYCLATYILQIVFIHF